MSSRRSQVDQERYGLTGCEAPCGGNPLRSLKDAKEPLINRILFWRWPTAVELPRAIVLRKGDKHGR